MILPRFLIGAACASVGVIPAQSAPPELPFARVEKRIQEQTQLTVRWQQDAAAREATAQTVSQLLRQPLTMKSAVQIALLNNRALLATFEDVGVSVADLEAAGVWKNPSFELSARFPDRAPRGINWEEAAAFDLLDLLLLPLRKRVAAELLASAQLRVADAVLQLVADTKTAVYRLQADRQLAERLQAIHDGAAAALQLAQKQHEAGNITDLDLLRQQAQYNEARLELASAQAEQQGHREMVNRQLGLWGKDTNWRLAASLPPLPERDVPLAGLESLAVAQRLDLGSARAELTSMVRALGLTKSYRFVGALDLGVDTERDPDRSNLTGPTLRLELPIFHQGQARVARGEAELRRAERKLEGLAIDIRAEVRELHAQLAAQREVARFYRDEIIPDRQAIVSQSLLRYNGMLLGNYEVFAAQAEAAAAERKSVEALRQYWTTRAALERAVGGNLQLKSKP